MRPEAMLRNPIWYALTTEQRHRGVCNEFAARFHAEIGPLGGMLDQSLSSYRAMEELLHGEAVALFLQDAPSPPPDWQIIHHDTMYQMVWEGEAPRTDEAQMRMLAAADVPAMTILAELTEPGPFRSRTIELGGYRGIFIDSRLASMAGERLHLPGFTEVSAVCTHPDFRMRGYSKKLVAAVGRGILQAQKTPILHVRCHNPAVELYKALGFQVTRTLHLAVVKRGLPVT